MPRSCILYSCIVDCYCYCIILLIRAFLTGGDPPRTYGGSARRATPTRDTPTPRRGAAARAATRDADPAIAVSKAVLYTALYTGRSFRI